MLSSRAVLPRRRWIGILILPLLVGWLPGTVRAEEPAGARVYGEDPQVGIEEHLGRVVPLDLVFDDEEGNPVKLGDLIERPTVLTIVYFRCPRICSPLMHEVADTVDRIDLVPGEDFDLLTVSFDSREDHELAAQAQDNLLGGMKRDVPPEAWRFLTGSEESILALTEAVGFYFQWDDQPGVPKEKRDFVHAGTVIFLTSEGKIVRYLGGLTLLPFDLKMAIIDAKQGRERSMMQRVQALCYGYDPDGKTYVLLVNRIVLFVSLFILGVFLAVLLLKRRKVPVPTPAGAGADEPGEDATPDTPAERSHE
jgi:protein SCO1/2